MQRTQRRGRRRWLHAVVGIVLAGATATVGLTPHPAQAQAVDDPPPVEALYGQRKPGVAVTYDNDGDRRDGNDACSLTEFAPSSSTVVFPTNLGAGGTTHPILVWGNGTNLIPGTMRDPVCYYRPALEHLASWGFVIIAPDGCCVGDGTWMLDMVESLVDENGDARSVFYGQLDTTRIGSIGHSQGATGAIRAAIASMGTDTPITSTVGLATADPYSAVWPPGWPVDDLVQSEREIRESGFSGPVFFVRGDCDQFSTDRGDSWYYNAVAGAAVKATVLPSNPCFPFGDGAGGSHLDVSNADGYITAWFMYTLVGDEVARSAFVGGPPEIATNPGWIHWESKGLE